MDYLVLLKREAGSYLARPFRLSDFPGIPFEYTEVLKSRGLKNTRDFFEKVQTGEQKAKVSKETGIPLERLWELQARQASPVGNVSIEDTEAYYAYLSLTKMMEKRGYATGHFSEEDIRYCIDYAKVLAEADNEAEE